MSLKDKVIDEIKKIYDPEIPVNIYELGHMWSNITANKAHVKSHYEIEVIQEHSSSIKI